MSFILAIESDPRQAAALSHVVRDRVPGAQLTVVDSKDGALAAIKKTAPDLILFTALFSPREEEELIAHLRTLEGADHLQTLTIPLLAASDNDDGKARRGLFGFKKKKAAEVPTQGCDPVVFAEQIVGYLKTAADLKANAEAARIAAERAARRASETAAEAAAAEPVVERAIETVETIAETPSEPMYTPIAEPVVAQAPEPAIVQAPEPVVAQAPEKPLVGYSVNSLGELLSKEDAVESAPPADPTPVSEPQIFGSVLFAKVRPKREIKSFAETPPVVDEAPAHQETPIIDDLPIVAETPVVLAAPVVEPAPVEPLARFEPPPPADELRPVHAARVAEPQRVLKAPQVVESPPAPEPQKPVRLVQRLPPLAMWARRLQDADATHAAGIGDSANGSDEGPLGVLRIPPAIATISYPTGCRIRRVIAKRAS